MKIALVTDSTADIPPQLLEQHNIGLIRAILVINGQEYVDGVDISRQDYYEQLPDLDPPPTTATPAPGVYTQLYQRAFDQGAEHIVSIHVASQLSGIYATAQLAAQEFEGRVTVVDSGQLSMGIGLQVLEAAEAIENGADLAQTLAVLADTHERIRVLAMLNTLEQLRRSGRVSWTRASLGALLRVKVFINLRFGEVIRHGDTRTRKKGIAQLNQHIHDLGPYKRLAILHSNAEEEARAVLAAVSQPVRCEPLLVNVTPIIGTHVGVRALGFAGLPEK